MSPVSRPCQSEHTALAKLVRPGGGRVVGKKMATGEFAVFTKIGGPGNGKFPTGYQLERTCSNADAGTISEALAENSLILVGGAEDWCRVDIKETPRSRGHGSA